MWYWHIDRHTEQWKRIIPRNKPLHSWSIDFLTRVSRQFNRERIIFSTNGTGISGYLQAKLDPYLTSYTKTNSKWINTKRQRQQKKKMINWMFIKLKSLMLLTVCALHLNKHNFFFASKTPSTK